MTRLCSHWPKKINVDGKGEEDISDGENEEDSPSHNDAEPFTDDALVTALIFRSLSASRIALRKCLISIKITDVIVSGTAFLEYTYFLVEDNEIEDLLKVSIERVGQVSSVHYQHLSQNCMRWPF